MDVYLLVYSLLLIDTVACVRLWFEPADGALIGRIKGHHDRNTSSNGVNVPFHVIGGCPSRPDQVLHMAHSSIKSQRRLVDNAKADCAYLVQPLSNVVEKSSPILRLLIMLNPDYLPSAHTDDTQQRSPIICVKIYVTHDSGFMSGACSVSNSGHSGYGRQCVAQVVMHQQWFTADNHHAPGVKQLGLYYNVTVNRCVSREIDKSGSRETLDFTKLMSIKDKVELIEANSTDVDVNYVMSPVATETFSNVSWTQSLLLPSRPLFGNSVITAYVHMNLRALIERRGIVLRSRLSLPPGIHLIAASNISADWTIHYKVNHKRIVLFRLSYTSKNQSWAGAICELVLAMSGANTLHTHFTNGSLVMNLKWQTIIVGSDDHTDLSLDDFPPSASKGVTELTLHHDQVVQVVPILKPRALLNTAVLSGQTSTHALVILAVTATGLVADVSRGNGLTCSSSDMEVVKVSPSCTTVYFDGAESYGSDRVTIHIKYSIAGIDGIMSTLDGHTTLTVWYPSMPLRVHVSNPVLHPIANWTYPTHTVLTLSDDNSDGNDTEAVAMALTCHPVYQQAQITVFAQFECGKSNSKLSDGTDDYDITRFVRNHITVVDTSVATVKPTGERDIDDIAVLGRSSGTTDVRVFRPMTSETIGVATINVAMESVHITGLNVAIAASTDFSLTTTALGEGQASIIVKSKFTRKYQHGYVTLSLDFSDGSHTDLNDIDPAAYLLDYSSSDETAVNFNMIDKAKPSTYGIIVSGGGETTPTLTYTLTTPMQCWTHHSPHLVVGSAKVLLDISDDYLTENTEEPSKPSNESSEITLSLPGPHSIIHKVATVVYDEEASRVNREYVDKKHGNDHKDLSKFEIGLLILLSLFMLIGFVMAFNFLLLYANNHRNYGQRNNTDMEHINPRYTACEASSGCTPSTPGDRPDYKMAIMSGRSISWHDWLHHKLTTLRRRGESKECREEWVWLSKEQIQNGSTTTRSSFTGGSINSKYSRRSTANVGSMEGERNSVRLLPSNTLSPNDVDEHTYFAPPSLSQRSPLLDAYSDVVHYRNHANGEEEGDFANNNHRPATATASTNSVSYRGSEVSIFISWQPSMQVHENVNFRYSTPTDVHQPSTSHMTSDNRLSSQPKLNRREYDPTYVQDDCGNYPIVYSQRSWNHRSGRANDGIGTSVMTDSSCSEQNVSTVGINPSSTTYSMNTVDRCMMAAAEPNEWADNTSALGADDDELLEYFEGMRESCA